MKKVPGVAPMPVAPNKAPCPLGVMDDDDYEPYDDDLFGGYEPQPARAMMYKDHRCLPMVEHEKFRNEGRPYRYHRKFVIRYSPEGWKLYDYDAEGMSIVQCPFCHERMFVGNQVTIE